MTTMERVLLLGFAGLMSCGQLLFKLGANHRAADGRPAGVLGVMLHPSVLCGLALYGVATILWIKLLQSIPLSAAYPYAALAFVFVPVASVLCLGEEITPQYIGGSCLIVVGVTIIGFSS